MLAGAGGVAALLVLPGCTGGGSTSAPTSAAPSAPDPLLAVLEERQSLAAAYAAVGTAHPDLAGRMAVLQAQTEEQVLALRRALALPATTAPSTAPTGAGTGAATTGAATTSAGNPVVPPDPAAARAMLRDRLTTAAEHAAALCATTSPERAPFIGSLAAAATCHRVVLA